MGVASAVISGVVAVKGARDKKKAGKSAQDTAAENAAMEAATTAEEVKRMEAEQSKQQSLARARAAATGVSGTSMDVYMEAMQQTPQPKQPILHIALAIF